ncbi:hypothetical protein CPT_Musica_054 [Burkholderia phage Musica]|uniref:Uncharacterized protein n=1 Tax=Burkholderia phage Musica TaxID=2924903 RepID=A0AAE9GAG4_9CAUD|nr:hypothetical protein CPT_Musica_054 [Burkholderia phage Musica]
MGWHRKCFRLVPGNTNSASTAPPTYKLMHVRRGEIGAEDSNLKRRRVRGVTVDIPLRCLPGKPRARFFYRPAHAGRLSRPLGRLPQAVGWHPSARDRPVASRRPLATRRAQL